ncbi:PLD nuclease N-terminal domain-containing protein [Streptomyces sp. DSM 44917]|uniref:PLD nuclease N-terminal domain-containing protein n=1 Tax=Streptomyces boetiae TaxID=3075541 RepID=A0ABU2LEC1_9ACTN|nr:PLD nuclease N-terminal domain-containing protein [Streptomyces sp. DSM 44917]MDT0309622.1 PLD nuclease N-terminal domain-containing protein [Streptomyces sp. DSM 44917]
MLRVLLFLVPLALAVYALVDCISSDEEEIRHLPKLVWILLIVVAWVIGPLAWIFVGRRRGGGRGPLPRRNARGRGGWVAPDDNPEFLRGLAEERRLEERRKAREGERDSAAEAAEERPAEDRAEPEGEPERDGRTEEELLAEWEEDLRRRDGGDEDPPGGGSGRP